ncbi:MAG: hypothetical protein BECKG1743F_GA0114225_111093, partial [Candidatus Kentron sp. G]
MDKLRVLGAPQEMVVLQICCQPYGGSVSDLLFLAASARTADSRDRRVVL